MTKCLLYRLKEEERMKDLGEKDEYSVCWEIL